ncbi:lysophosphatidylcholine acyltransferase isoform X1 [Venturia canescens]|uniref:lysophosphatidylcholine acyltransferase isoform X1 n=1 Tax=Venturia canescens TaxID=32260 RepID=UPI001C9C31CD|nr:lysophosphatidylcholine acyltransferase isoform X1 [Venturia canescens]
MEDIMVNGKLQESKDEVDTASIDSDISNPFIHQIEFNTTYDKLKTAFLTVALLPFRLAAVTTLVIMAWLLACIGLHGLSEEDLRRAPLTGWRRDLRILVCWAMRAMFICGGFHNMKIKGEQATNKDAPILALAPHSSFFDALPVVYLGGPSIVAKAEVGRIPFFGKLINYTQPVYVWRDDPNSRQNTVKEIIERATSKEDWPQVMIFPEGTCTNRSCLITFKCGAFYPGVPVQPVCIRYPNKLDTVTWTWEGPGALKLLWLTLVQLSSSCEIEFLPVYRPSEAEKMDPKLYANNVRRVMAEALQIPVSDYTYDDCRIISKAHTMHLPHASSIIKTHKLRHKLGLHNAKTEEELVQRKNVNFSEPVNFDEFARILRLDVKDPSTYQLFKIQDRQNRGKVDLEEYIFTVQAIAKAETELDLISVAFEVCDSNGAKCLDANKLRKALRFSLQLSPEESDRIFLEANQLAGIEDSVNLEDVHTVLSTRQDFGHLYSGEIATGRRKKTI